MAWVKTNEIARLRHLAVALAVAGCAGSGSAPRPAPVATVARPRVVEPIAAVPPTPIPPSTACRAAYAEYVRAWSAWFDAELGDRESAAEIIAEFGQELPLRASLAEMHAMADALRYQPGWDLWFVALTATERAIDACGEGARRPRPPPG